ncbi:MAG: hypothetical protein K1W00_04500 [Lachnospiraceae bacterium]
MKKIIIGCFMILVNVYFYAGSSIIGLIPDFAGYILISNGIKECVEEINVYKKVQKCAFAACIFSAAIWVMDLTTATSRLYYKFGAEWGYAFRAVSIIFIGIVTYMLINVFNYVSTRYKFVYGFMPLRLSWLFTVLINMVMLIYSDNAVIYSWIALGEVLAALMFLVMLYLAFEKAFEVSKGKKL